jgi:hypothetical protein
MFNNKNILLFIQCGISSVIRFPIIDSSLQQGTLMTMKCAQSQRTL